jgi:hypothetical protein
MALPAAMQAVQDAPVLPIFYAVAIDLPATADLAAKRLRLLDGSGVLTFLGDTWVGADGDYGSLQGGDPIEESVATEAPKFGLTLMPLTDEAMQQIGAPLAQGSPITIYEGYLNPATGRPVSDPVAIWYGQLDIGHLTVGKNAKSIIIDVMCAAELMLLTDNGSTLSSSWHNEFFPGELGFGFVDSVTHPVPWGAQGPRPDQAINANNYGTAQNSGGGTTTLKF